MLRISREIFEAKNYESSDVINYILIIALRGRHLSRNDVLFLIML